MDILNCIELENRLKNSISTFIDKLTMEYDNPISYSDAKEEVFKNCTSLYYQSIKQNYFWQYCSLNTFKETFNDRLAEYKTKYIDANKVDFLESEYNQLLADQNFELYEFASSNGDYPERNVLTLNELIDSDTYQNIVLSQQKKFEFVKQQIQLENNDKHTNSVEPNIKPLQWKGNKVEFAELIKALIESNRIYSDSQINQKEIFNRLSKFFQFELNETTGIKDIRKRNSNDKSKFLKVLIDALNQWDNNQDNQNRLNR